MTRRIVYGISLWVFLGSAACTVASIILPNWISYTSPTEYVPIRVNYGLHKKCSSITGECRPFPQHDDCYGDDRDFCSMWRSTGFLLNFSLMAELACIVAYIVILCGGRAVRQSGWKILAGLLSLVAIAEMIGMALVAYLFDHDSRFFVGWELDKSWILCTVSWVVLLINAHGIVSAALCLPSEDGYELIPEPH